MSALRSAARLQVRDRWNPGHTLRGGDTAGSCCYWGLRAMVPSPTLRGGQPGKPDEAIVSNVGARRQFVTRVPESG
jgi:hypothetical protein